MLALAPAPDVVTVRALRPAEAADLAALGRAAWEARIAPLVGPLAAAALRRADAFGPLLAADRFALVAELDGRPAGFGLADRVDAYVADLWVAPACEGRGAGRALLLALEADLARRGAVRAHLQTLAANRRARALFARLGWREAWSGPRYDRAHDAVLLKTGMTKPLG